MRRLLAFLLCLLCALAGAGMPIAAPAPAGAAADSAPPLRGMGLGLFSKDPQYDYRRDLQELKALGVNAILLVVNWYSPDIRSNAIEPRPDHGAENSTISDEKLIQVIRAAHRQDMKVLLFPYLRFDRRGPKDWRGVLAPADFSVWAKNYERFILHYADLGKRHGVALLSVGSELGSMEEKTEFWKGLIAKVRSRFPGELLYSSNWDHYSYPTFWRELDYIAMTSYYPLSKKNDPEFPEMLATWQGLKKKILAFKAQYPQKLIFTEVGYPSLDGGNVNPWNYFAKAPVDVAEQALCYLAFIEAWKNTPELAGVFWWVWFDPGGPKDPGFSPRGKPAEEILRKWYGGAGPTQYSRQKTP
ncbi:hypothetical protein FBR05_14100 [Deltaproteobacteria bacterium PRO3]|nr:hypothetical protein [Deltaproteobacteria bacterium PRO3]